MPRGTENGTGNLAKTAFVTLGYLVVVFSYIHVLAYLRLRIILPVGYSRIK